MTFDAGARELKLLKLFRLRWVQVLLGLGVLGFAAGVWMLLHPAAFWLQPWRPQAQAVGSRFIFGPYPIEEDFRTLQAKGVTTVVSLLDSDLPYEMVLLGQEKELAAKYGMKVLNFPMASILGQSFGKDYVANSRAAAQAAIEDGGIVYVHCYLGLHRAANVRKILAEYSDTGHYTGSVPVERSADRLALDRAHVAFQENRMADALRELARIEVKTHQTTLLEAWSHYRLNQIDAARERFAAVTTPELLSKEAIDARSGLGYCDLRQNELAQADRHFSAILAKHPDHVPSVEGLGYVRYRQDRHAEARTLLERVLERTPDNTEVREILQKLRLSARHAVIVVVDGLRPGALGEAPAPRMQRLMAAGASTAAARAVGLTETLPSVATIVTGRSPAQHGVQYNNESAGERAGTLAVPTLFTRVRNGGGRSALYFGKRKLVHLTGEGQVHASHGPGLKDADWDHGASDLLAAQFAKDARDNPYDLALIHLREPDLAGHVHGWSSAQYLEAVRQADVAVGKIHDAILASTVAQQTTFILTADHGGHGTRHSSANPESWIIPFSCVGSRVRRGVIQEAVTLLDVAPTVLAVLGLPALPQAEGKAVGACVGSS